MAVRMRLTCVGSKKNPIYRVVVADQRSPRDGRFIEIVGRYNPQPDPSIIELDEAKVKEWLGKGAQPSDAVAKLLKVEEPRLADCAGETSSSISRNGSYPSPTPCGSRSSTGPTVSSCCGCTWRKPIAG